MYLMDVDPEFFLPFLIFSIPIIAIVGGITAGIVRTVGRQRLVEMAQRERITAIERGVDPTKLPPLPGMGENGDDPYLPRHEHDRRRAQSLMIGGIITSGVGIGLSLLLAFMEPGDRAAWAVGMLPLTIGLSLLLSAWLIRPKNGDSSSSGN